MRLATDLSLGAMGGRVNGCPPRQVAEEMKGIMSGEGFVGWFKEVVFAVHPVRRTGKTNYDVFKQVFEASES